MNAHDSAGDAGSRPDAYVIVEDLAGQRLVSLDDKTTLRIGRGLESDLLLEASFVSRQHAIVQMMEGGEYCLIDLGSVNGTYVNDVRVSVPRILRDGDCIAIGQYRLRFHGRDPALPVTRRASATPTFDATVPMFVPSLITILVVDIRNFTVLSQQVGEDVLCQTIGTWFRNGGRIMREQKSWGLKYIGDAIMAVWRHRDRSQVDADLVRILRAYVELAAISANLAAEFPLPWPIQIGAGLNTGMAALGNAGGGELDDFTAMGDTVNAAFRIESSTKEMGVDLALGPATFDALRSRYQPEQYFQQSLVSLKGYSAPMEVWGARLQTAQSFLTSCP
jgi:adenylate cyclase